MRITCGTDIIEISRIKENIDTIGEKFIEKIYTEKERNYCESKQAQKYQHYAARFAAKEAIFKAISESLDNIYSFSWKDAEIENDKNGKPQVHLNIMKKDDIESIDLSISHCKEYACANVVVLYK